jgi:2-polyprenyl-6-methoxyphenol hydroxylase-like FAD-dependent oxidoreductase
MTELPDSTDVLVVGAGPTGLTVATSLAAANVRSVVIDRVPQGENFSRAVGTVPRTLEMLEPLDLAGRLADMSNHAERVRVFSGDRNRNIVTLRLDRLSTRFPYIVILAQHLLEDTIAARLRELGTEVLRPLTLTGLTQDGSGVTATVTAPDGAERAIRAKYVVGADGPRSAVRSLTEVPFPGVTFRQPFVLADMRLGNGPPDDEIHLFFSRHGAVIMGHMPSDVFRVCLSLDHAPESAMTAEEAEELLQQRGPADYEPKVIEILHSSRTRVHHRIAQRFRSGRILLAGDAAHVNSPIIGQGMNLGIQEGVTLGAKLAATLRTGVDSLDDYERERRPIAKNAVGITNHINEIATLRSSWGGALRDTLFPAGNFPPLNKQITRRLSRLIDR